MGARAHEGGSPVIDVDRLMAEIRATVARRRAEGVYGQDPAAVDLELDGPLTRLAARAAVRGTRASMRSDRPYVGPAVTLVRRLVVKAASPFLADVIAQITAFNEETVRYLRWLEEALETEIVRREGLEHRVGLLESRLEELRDERGP